MKKILYASIPFLVVVVVMLWSLILKGFSSSSDFLVLSSASATGILIVALYLTIKFYLKKLYEKNV
jgi:phosphoglycerol transferase MdoB-like AlkP superfamily enzyme